MGRLILSIIMALHGLIHLIGFVRAFTAGGDPLDRGIIHTRGVLWFLTALLFVIAAVLQFSGRNCWWMAAVPPVVLSQALIVLHWSDARFGTAANVIIMVAALVAWGEWSFDGMAEREVSSFIRSSSINSSVFTERISELPPVVRTWLKSSGALDRPGVHTVHLHQRGKMRTTPSGRWMDVVAEQWFTTSKPNFLWRADVTAVPGIHLAGRDLYREGRGHMLIKFLSLVPVADERGPAIDQGAMVRYMAEIIWFPSAALSDYIRWRGIDSRNAEATMTWRGITASGIFSFNDEGNPLSFIAKRYYYRKEGSTMETWRVIADPDSVVDFGGMRIPSRARAEWILPDGEFTWFTVEVTDIDYDAEW